ncbi:hypothetical protein OPT61_g5357 [Boeremia exigua]|uniref:Uncharacterized protein n=1 Tax=Boeremia exigua TaxID=749465 RepID=A0ACC2IAR4_9PLEO|nr:hypothetical protein OPT61_g5357 [Boeremia exigua]
MSSEEGKVHETQYNFANDGGRPEVEQYDQNSALRPNDQVYILSLPGRELFTVREVRNGKCTLRDKNGVLVGNGQWFKESELELEDP